MSILPGRISISTGQLVFKISKLEPKLEILKNEKLKTLIIEEVKKKHASHHPKYNYLCFALKDSSQNKMYYFSLACWPPGQQAIDT